MLQWIHKINDCLNCHNEGQYNRLKPVEKWWECDYDPRNPPEFTGPQTEKIFCDCEWGIYRQVFLRLFTSEPVDFSDLEIKYFIQEYVPGKCQAAIYLTSNLERIVRNSKIQLHQQDPPASASD